MNVDRIISRKFILALFALVSATFLCYDGRIADGVYSTVVIATVGAYITGNVFQKKNGIAEETKRNE